MTAIKARIKALDEHFRQLPDPREATSLAAMDRATAARNLAIRRRSDLVTYAQRVSELRAKLDEETAWRDVLLEARGTLELRLAALEALPRRSDASYRDEDALRSALNQIQHGVEWVGSFSMISPALLKYLRDEAHVQPKAGYGDNPWSGRGSLVATEERIAEYQRALDEAQSRIDRELATPVPDSQSGAHEL